jgi:hypothetical protein
LALLWRNRDQGRADPSYRPARIWTNGVKKPGLLLRAVKLTLRLPRLAAKRIKNRWMIFRENVCRPPFMLLMVHKVPKSQRTEKEKTDSRFQRIKKAFCRHLILYHWRRSPATDNTEDPGRRMVDYFSLYLLPDRLRWYSLAFGIIPGIPLLLYGEWWPGLWVIGLSVLWASGIYPFFMFFVLKKRVLKDACRNWREDEYRDNYHVARLKWLWPVGGADTVLQIVRYAWNFLPSFRKQTDPIAWSKDGSVQETFVRLAANDFFVKQTSDKVARAHPEPPEDLRVMRLTRLRRIMAYWASPVVAGYFVLVALVVCRVFWDGPMSPSQLVVSVFLWLGLCVLFFAEEPRALRNWTGTAAKAIPYTPPPIRYVLDDLQRELETITEDSTARLFNVVYLAGTAVLLVAIGIIN